MNPQRRTHRPQREMVRPEPVASFLGRRYRPERFPFLWHYHPEVELTLIVRGSGLRFVGDSIKPFEAGDLVLIGSNVPHTWQSTESTDDVGYVESIVFQFLPTLGGGMLEHLPELAEVRRLLADAAYGLSVEGDAARGPIHAEMHRAVAAPPGSVTRLCSLMQSLQLIVDARSRSPKSVRPLSTRSYGHAEAASGSIRQLERIFASLSESLTDGERFTQEQAADLIGMSPAAFSRFFRQSVGRTFTQYVKEWRIELACRALVQSRQPITDIAFASGFENLSNFNRRFREVVGTTPRAFRQLG